MAWRDKLRRLWGRDTDFEKWNTVARRSEELLRERSLRGVTDLVKRHRRSNPIITGIAIQLSSGTDYFLTRPRDAAESDVRELMEALRRTSVVRKNGSRLQDAPAGTTNPVYGILAMHTVLLDTLQIVDFDAARPQPSDAEVQAAVRILKNQYESDIMHRLCHFVEGGYLPPFYIAGIYNWQAELDILSEMRTKMRGPECPKDPQQLQQLRVNIWQLENRMSKEAEQVLEKMNLPLPGTYIEKLDAELQTLGWLARFPERIDDSRMNLQLLDKYDIRRGAPRKDQCRQVEDAFRELDGRLARLTGRRPYADDLFQSLKRKEAKVPKPSSPKADVAPEPGSPAQTQGRKKRR